MATRNALQDFAGMTGTKTAPATPAAAEPLVAEAPGLWAAFAGILVQASKANGGIVYVGAQGVTTTNGIALAAGESVFLPVSSPSRIFVVGSVAAQTVIGIGV